MHFIDFLSVPLSNKTKYKNEPRLKKADMCGYELTRTAVCSLQSITFLKATDETFLLVHSVLDI